jgi:hypothetical protein
LWGQVSFFQSLAKLQKHWLLVSVFVLVGFLHIWHLSSLPHGVYVDEASVGYNAALIAQTGRDEHGHFLPVYFEAFGEYKNAPYIYSVAALVKVLGVSIFSVRLASFLWFMAFILVIIVLSRKLAPGVKYAPEIAACMAGTIPWFFPLSRLGFEVVTQLFFVTLSVYLLYRVYEEGLSGWFTGLVLAMSLYSYSTGRLFAFMVIGLIFAIYRKRDYLMRHIEVGVGFFLGLLPYIYFSLQNPGALTARIRALSPLFDDSVGQLERVLILLKNYLLYLNPVYLLVDGDSNLRHSIGGGLLSLGAAILIGFATYRFVKGKREKFTWFVVGMIFVAPIPAALTEPGHALRSVIFGLSLLYFAMIGLRYIQGKVLAMVAAVLVVLAGVYMYSYFFQYPSKSVKAMEDGGLDHVLLVAQKNHKTSIIGSRFGNHSYANFEFYRLTHPDLMKDVIVGPPVASKGRCIVTFDWDDSIKNPNVIQETLRDENQFVNVVCY